MLTTVDIGQSDVAARERRPANPACGCLLPSCAPISHHSERTQSETPNLSALDDWATSNRVLAMYPTRLANNTCGKGELISGFPSIWVVKSGPQRSSGSVWVRVSQGDLQLHVIHIVRQTTQQIPKTRGSSVNLTSRLSGGSGSKIEISYQTRLAPNRIVCGSADVLSFLVPETRDHVSRTWPSDTKCSAPEI